MYKMIILNAVLIPSTWRAFVAQIFLAVLARGYDWSIDPDEPLKTFPLILPAWGLPMTFWKLDKPVTAREE